MGLYRVEPADYKLGQPDSPWRIQRLLRNPKSLCLAVTKWIDREFGEAGGLGYGDESLSFSVSPIFDMWQNWERFGVLPASGGWADQPLPALVHISGLGLVHRTWSFYRAKEFDMKELTPTQLDLLEWLESE